MPEDLFPIVIIEDRYHGLYSGGLWFAIAEADTPYLEVGDFDPTRAAFCLDNGPNGDDDEAIAFWADRPDWIAAGATPEQAIELLRQGF